MALRRVASGLVLSRVVVKEIVFGVVCPSCLPMTKEIINRCQIDLNLERMSLRLLVIYCQLAEQAR